MTTKNQPNGNTADVHTTECHQSDSVVEGVEHFLAMEDKFLDKKNWIEYVVTTLKQTAQQEKEEIVKRADMEIYALENTLEKSKELSVAIGRKKVYERIKLISEYKGKLEAWKEIKAIAQARGISVSDNQK